MDDRVCMHYVIDRIEYVIKMHDPENPEIADMKYMYEALDKWKDELIYNLGVNRRIDYKEVVEWTDG
jgi:hypothetical protein